jgi:CDP-diglyceride synthetase
MFPILATQYYYKEESAVPWLRKKTSYFLLLVPLTLGILNFFGDAKGNGTVGQLFVLSIIVCALLAIGYSYGRRKYEEGKSAALTIKPFWLGVSTFFFTMALLTIGIAGLKLPVFIFISTAVLGVMFYIRKIKVKQSIQKETLLFFLVGCYTQTVVTTFLMVIATNPALLIERVISSGIIFLILFFLMKRIKSNPRLK